MGCRGCKKHKDRFKKEIDMNKEVKEVKEVKCNHWNPNGVECLICKLPKNVVIKDNKVVIKGDEGKVE